ncbi:hypothetical protein E6O75_ATG11472 [Venturia nashicola]|uniref:Isomerase YbhE n=1 Tax=Venturia nashicola TaxID=86259 RepID=A0A4Z1NYN6_9PEZI|nr:hypothetical protein E6O75_ATG11472 [Venturia nashicola]
MLNSIPLLALLSAPLASAVNLYVSSYTAGPWSGNITTLSLARNANSTYSLSQTHSLNTSTNSPAWLTLNRQNNVLYLMDEALTGSKGTLSTYSTSYTGNLTKLSHTETSVGGVHGGLYASGQALAVAHYMGSTLRTYSLSDSGKDTKPLEIFNFSSPDFTVGPIADRQRAPHPHQTILDPTQQFLLVPDLGSDFVRIFSIDQKTFKLNQLAPFKTPAGYGPRHGKFSLDKISGTHVFYLIGELKAEVTAFGVGYKNGSITFDKIASYSTFNPGQKFPLNPDGSTQVAPAEIDITPDGFTLIVSNRNDATFGTSPPIDSLATFSISPKDGTLTKLPLISAHGSFPRHFQMNKAGTLMAVPHQKSGSLAILEKNKSSGLFDQKVASIKFGEGADQPVSVVWDE